MASAKQTLIVRPIFFGPISIALFVFCFAVALPLTTIPLPDNLSSFNQSSVGVLFVVGPALVIGLMVAYPTVTHLNQLRFLFPTSICWNFPSSDWKKPCERWTEVMTLRIYFRDLDIMKKQLLGISFDNTKSSCCDQEHQTSTGTLGRSFF